MTPEERQRKAEQNRRDYPEAVAVMERLNEMGFGPVKATYAGPMRVRTQEILRLKGERNDEVAKLMSASNRSI